MNTFLSDLAATKLQPLGDRVLVKRMVEETESLIIIPDAAKDNSKVAEVMAVGPKAFGVKAGDVVLLPGIASKYPDWEECYMMMVTVKDIGGIFQGIDIPAGNA
jgi:co-chaperonin GroES (HSP10)